MPNKEHLSAWVRALLSGKYKQGQGALNHNGSYCCLGVACDISGTGNWRPETFGDAYVTYAHDYSSSTLPLPVLEWLGLKNYESNPSLDVGDHYEHAATLNDESGWSFRQIAEAIVRTYGLDPALLEEGNDGASEV